ncbi:MAG: hypothetical protein FWG61_01010, partial [Firmicutes bacterium]|nr:hypothetical protein [Bacillota bacterium]
MTKKLIAITLVALLILCVALPALAANSLDALKAQVPAGAVMFNADGASTNGHSGPEIIWWDYDSVAKTGTVYLIVANAQSGKVAVGATIGSTAGTIIDYYAPGGNATAYTLIKFTNIWLYGDELLSVNLGAGGQNMNGKISDYFPQLKNINYWNDVEKLGSDTQLSGSQVTVWDIDYLPEPPTGHDFLGWSYHSDAEEVDVLAGATIVMGNDDINLYAVWAPKTGLYYEVYYLEQGTNKILAAKKVVDEQTFGTVITENAIDITGYNKVAPTSATITIAEEGNIINFYYTARNDLSYEVNYLEQGTNKVLA